MGAFVVKVAWLTLPYNYKIALKPHKYIYSSYYSNYYDNNKREIGKGATQSAKENSN